MGSKLQHPVGGNASNVGGAALTGASWTNLGCWCIMDKPGLLANKLLLALGRDGYSFESAPAR